MTFSRRTSATFAAFIATATVASSQEKTPRGFSPGDEPPQWEARLRAVPLPENMREYMRVITEEPHHAGSPGSKAVAEYVLKQFKSWGLQAWIEEHEALMPTPVERVVELVEPELYRAQLKEPPLVEDKDSSDENQLPSFNAYSADGDVTAQLVYVNYGTPEDYEELARLGVDVKGKIVVARYGRSWRGIKPKVAGEHGAVGCIIYSDPKDDGYSEGDIYPEGPMRPWQGVQRGSVMDMPVHPGDPLSPGWGGEKGARKLEMAQAKTILKIPVLPISYGDALPLLRAIRGPVAPSSFRGALPITYHVGPGPAKVHLKLSFDWKVRPLYNVLARIDGASFPDEWIIAGNHHDAWVNGASDPTSGNVALIETARAFAEIVRQGFRPKRTLLFASWDGEEWGLLGSTEWAEKHAAELKEKAVAYINSDSNGKGWLGAAGSHSLQRLVNDVARDVVDPKTGGSVHAALRERSVSQARTDEAREEIRKREDLPIDALGSGSDYTVFVDHLAISSLNLGFGGDGSSNGVYHSIYDSFDWFTRFSDGTFEYGRALSQTIGTTMLRLSEATVLPFRFTDTADTLAKYVDEIEKEIQKQKPPQSIDVGPIKTAISKLKAAATAYEADAVGLAGATPPSSKTAELRALNRLLYTAERRLGSEKGLPRREWFKHQIYAPGFYTGYGVKTLPALREGVEEKQWDEARAAVPTIAAAIESLASQVDQARAAVRAVTN